VISRRRAEPKPSPPIAIALVCVSGVSVLGVCPLTHDGFSFPNPPPPFGSQVFKLLVHPGLVFGRDLDIGRQPDVKLASGPIWKRSDVENWAKRGSRTPGPTTQVAGRTYTATTTKRGKCARPTLSLAVPSIRISSLAPSVPMSHNSDECSRTTGAVARSSSPLSTRRVPHQNCCAAERRQRTGADTGSCECSTARDWCREVLENCWTTVPTCVNMWCTWYGVL
jgi:hypothetical protein